MRLSGIVAWAFLAVFLLPPPAAAQTGGRQLYVGGLIGFQNGPSAQISGEARGFAQGLPMSLRLRLGRTGSPPGSAPDARRIFINDATNGTPMKSGRTLDLGLDAVVPRGDRNQLYVGLRHSRFKANFKFVGGNEDFDVTSTHWGIAAGFERAYPMGRRTDLLLSGGAEYYRAARLSGHDTSYSPDGENVNPRQDYSYSDADQAVSQPKLRPVIVVGVRRRLGR